VSKAKTCIFSRYRRLNNRRRERGFRLSINISWSVGQLYLELVWYCRTTVHRRMDWGMGVYFLYASRICCCVALSLISSVVSGRVRHTHQSKHVCAYSNLLLERTWRRSALLIQILDGYNGLKVAGGRALWVRNVFVRFSRFSKLYLIIMLIH